MFIDHPANWFALAVMMPIAFLALLLLSKSKFVIRVLFLVSALKAILVVANCYGKQFFFYDADFSTLDELAKGWASMPLADALGEIHRATGRYFFAFLLGFLYRGVGEAHVYVFLANIYLTALVASCTYDSVRCVTGSERFSRIALLWVALLPMYFMYCLTPSREPMVEAGFAVAMKHFCYWTKDAKPQRIAWIVVGLLVAASIHSAMALALLFIMGSIALISFRNRERGSAPKRSRRMVSFVMLAIVAAITLPPLIFSGWALSKFGGSVSGVTDINTLERYAERNEARTGYLGSGSGDFGSPIGAIKSIPLRFAYFISKPWPWDIGAPADLVAVYVNVFLSITIYLATFRRRTLNAYPPATHISTCVFLLSVVFAFGTANWGTGTRHKTKFFPGMALVVAVYMNQRRVLHTKNMNLSVSHPLVSR